MPNENNDVCSASFGRNRLHVEDCSNLNNKKSAFAFHRLLCNYYYVDNPAVSHKINAHFFFFQLYQVDVLSDIRLDTKGFCNITKRVM